jgi:DNA topoisomerase-3
MVETARKENGSEKQPLGLCPKCGEPVYQTPFGYACDGGRECGFVIWREVGHRHIPRKAAEELVKDGITSRVLHGFKSKDGKEFAAKLRLDPENEYKVAYEFEAPRVIGKCPECDGEVVEKPKSWSCTKWREADGRCGFVIWKTIAGRNLTEADALALLAGSTIGPYPFRSQEGKEFTAYLRLNPEEGHKVQMGFPDEEDADDPDYGE